MNAPHPAKADDSRGRRLVLDVGLAGDELRAALSEPTRDRQPVQTCAIRAIDLEALGALHDRVIGVLNRANRWGDLDQGSRELLRQHGQMLFDEVLPQSVKGALREACDGELTLVLDERLMHLPWELMHTGEAFLGLAFAVGRIVRTPQRVIGQPRPRPSGAWQMLIVCDPRGDLLGSYYEGVTLRDELDGADRRLRIDLRSSEVGVSDVKQLVREYDMLHYAGHAEHHPDRPHDSGWLLSDGNLSPGDLLQLAGGRPFPRLVFSNACRSGTVEGPLVPADRGEQVFSLANALLLSGVQHYVGTLWDVPDEPACHFSLAFYEALLEGRSLGEAMRRARRALMLRYGRDTVLWASYLLYGDPATPCFQAAEPAQATARPRGSDERPIPASAPRPDDARPRAAATRVRGRAAAAAWSDVVEDDDDGARRRWLGAAILAALLVVTAWAIASMTSGGSKVWHAGPAIAAGSEAETFPARELPPSPAPRARLDGNPATPTAPPAAPAAVANVEPPELAAGFRAVVQRTAEDGLTRPVTLQDGGTLHSWDNFQLHFRLGREGYAAVWHVESQGTIRRIHPDARDQPTAMVDHVSWVQLPGQDTWYYLDDKRGTELFVLTVDEAGDVDEDAVERDLAPLVRRLERVRSAQRGEDGPALEMRGMGGHRKVRQRISTDDRPLVDEVKAVFDRHYDGTLALELRHR